MDGNTYLGIYFSKTEAVAVTVTADSPTITAGFKVTADSESETNNFAELTQKIADQCAQMNIKPAEVAAALDCSMFMQHDVHSEFSETRQIAQTVRFDTEEAIATDISTLALTFKKVHSTENGSGLVVFTTEKQPLSDLITALANNKLDPVSIEADIVCLDRAIQSSASDEKSRTFIAALSDKNAYFIIKSDNDRQQFYRSFLIGQNRNHLDLLTRELPVTLAAHYSETPVDLKILDTETDPRELSNQLTMPAEKLEIPAENIQQDIQPADLAIALGAARAVQDKQRANFRDDFMPYMGRKLRIQRKLRILSVAVVLLLIALGLNLQMKVIQQNRYASRLNEKFASEYRIVMRSDLPDRTNPSTALQRQLIRIKNLRSGQISASGEDSLSAKLTLVLGAFNEVAKSVDLELNTINVTTRTISIHGSTSSRQNTLKLKTALESRLPFTIQEDLNPVGGRDNFRLTLHPK